MRKVDRLRARQVATAKPRKGRRAGLIADGGGLYLQCTIGKEKNVRRSWLFRYQLGHARHDVGLGPVQTVRLHEAREKARRLRQQLLDSIDPLTEKKKARQALLAEKARVTFREVAEMYRRAHGDSWRSTEHRQQWQNSLATYVLPKIGALPVSDVDTSAVVRILEPIWKEKRETASRVRGRIEAILDFATAREFRRGDNPARWKGHLSELFPAKTAPVKHFKAIAYPEMPAFMSDLRRRDSIAAKGLEILVLTASRSSQVIGAVWGEINLDAKEWVVPAKRMKREREHIVPLCERAIEVLSGIERAGDRIFPITKNTMLQLLQSLRPSFTAHGMRSAFYDWATERTATADIVIKMALSHVVGDKTERAYRRGHLFEKRQRLMAQWEEFLSRPVGVAAATPIRRVDGNA
jgi:integrase